MSGDLPHELVAVGSIARLCLLVAGRIVERHHRAARHQSIQAVFQLLIAQLFGGRLGSDGVSQSQTRHPVNFRKCARYDDTIIVRRTLDERSIVRTGRDKVMVGLVYQNIRILRQFLDEVFNVAAGREIACGIVGITNVNQPSVSTGGLQHGAKIVGEVGGKRDWHHLGADHV